MKVFCVCIFVFLFQSVLLSEEIDEIQGEWKCVAFVKKGRLIDEFVDRPVTINGKQVIYHLPSQDIPCDIMLRTETKPKDKANNGSRPKTFSSNKQNANVLIISNRK